MSAMFVFTSSVLTACNGKSGDSGTETGTDNPTAEPILTLSESNYYLSGEMCEYSAVLSLPAAMVTGDTAAWAKELKWSLTRDADDSPYRKGAVKLNVYTGDELKNWCSWGSDGTYGLPLFTINEPQVSVEDGIAEITLNFTSSIFHSTLNGFDYSEFTAFVGTYDFSVLREGETLCTTPFEVSLYEGFVAYSDYDEKLAELKTAAEDKGRYFDVRCCGYSVLGEPQNYVIVADSEASVNEYLKYKERAVKEPEALMKELYENNGKKPHIVVMTNGVHANENPSSDTQMVILEKLAKSDTLDFCSLNGLKSGATVDKGLFPSPVSSIDGFTGLGSYKVSAENDFETDATEYFSVSDTKSINVSELLDSAIMLIGLNENPDGAMLSTRTNMNGFGLNGEITSQSQQETRNFAVLMNEWNPSVFVEFHGFNNQFLVEPFTPPHEPNFEYDLLADNMVRCAEAFGNAAIGSLSALENYETKFCSYNIPLRDAYDSDASQWAALSDSDITVGSTYAMLNCGSLGFTIESPANSAAGIKLLQYGFFGMLDYVIANRDAVCKNQLEYFRRAVNNEDHRAEIQKWYVSSDNTALAADTWRVPNPKSNNFFPEYYIIPTDADSQRDVADAWALAEYFLRNGVEVRKLLSDCIAGGKSYKAGSLVVDMRQAKRNYVNAVLYDGMDFVASGFDDPSLLQHISLPHAWGFDCDAVFDAGIFAGKLSDAIADSTPVGTVKGEGDYAVIANNGSEAVRAVNSLLGSDETIGMITSGERTGDFVVSKKTYEKLAQNFVLSAEYTSKLPDSKKINRPTLWIAGKREPYYKSKIVTGYFSEWFNEGFRYEHDENMLELRTYYYDLFAFEKQLGFSVTDNADSADIILGSTAFDWSEEAAINAIRSGKPYIAMGINAVSDIADKLQINDYVISTPDTESLHRVSYASDSLVTARQKRTGDNVIYSHGCASFSSIPANARVLIKAADKCLISGSCGSALDGAVEAVEITRDGMDITAFANSVTYYAYQPDDLLFATNAIFSKSLSEAALTAEDF